MIVTELDFTPDLVWAMEDGFHVSGTKRYLESPRPQTYLTHYHNNKKEALYTFDTINIPFHVLAPSSNHFMFFSSLDFYLEIIKTKTSTFSKIRTMITNKKHPEMEKLENLLLKQCEGLPKSVLNWLTKFDYNNDYDALLCQNRLWILKENKCIYNRKPNLLLNDVRFSPDGKTLAIAGSKDLHFFDLDTNQIKYALSFDNSIIHLAYSLDGLTIATITKNNLIVCDVE